MKFFCDFGGGVTAEVLVSDECPQKGTSHIQKTEWTGQPTKKHLRPYIAWVNSINTELSSKWNIKIAHVFQVTPTSGDMWVYEPNKPPKRVAIMHKNGDSTNITEQ